MRLRLRLLVALCAVLTFETRAGDSIFGKTYYGSLDESLATNWFRGQRYKPAGKKVRVELEIFDDGEFEYRVERSPFRGYLEVSTEHPVRIALYFDVNTHLPIETFIPLSASADLHTLETPLFTLSDEPLEPPGPKTIATFSARLDSEAAKNWWKKIVLDRDGELLPTKLSLLEGSRFRYEVGEEILVEGRYQEKDLGRGKIGYRLYFDAPAGKWAGATYLPREKTLSFNYRIRFTLDRQ